MEHVIKNQDGKIAEKNSHGDDSGTFPADRHVGLGWMHQMQYQPI
ncbi:hypothetical protein [Arthrobacter globiformis]|nr:hypothetical protein [Arthrobacter globiformis]MDQ0616388.1 hypothetical protein [Arthrobacter globiformis]